jgi:glutathione S-transferase
MMIVYSTVPLLQQVILTVNTVFLVDQMSRIRKAETDFSKALQILQDTLSQSKEKCKQNEERDDDCHDYFLMGPHLTLADIFIVSTLIYPFQMAFDRDYLVLQSFDTVVEWFEKCVRRSEFCAVLGTVEIGSKKTTSNREGAAMPPIPSS